RAVIPFKPRNPKNRLASVLDSAERDQFACAMLEDVIDAVTEAGCEPFLLCTHPFSHPRAAYAIHAAGLNDALNALFCQSQGPLLVIMADLPLADAPSVARVCATSAAVALVPGRGGGTNAIFLREPKRFRANFYGASFLKHRRIAEEAGTPAEVIDSFRLHTDIDEPDDLVEVLIHGGAHSRALLGSIGFALSIENGRVGVKRDSHEQTF
ncbi:MAG: 2-phospho-L-lactate guanylyltransferase, partial [Methanobacteriota archaeon]